MKRTNRASRSQARGHLAGALVASVVGATVAIMFSGDPVGAAASAPRTVTVTFTDSGPSPASVQVNSGDSIKFVNSLSQSGKVPVAGGLLGQVQSAGVTVHDAATSDFGLPKLGDSRTLTYTGPQTVKYSATYTMSLLPVLNILGVNLLPATTTKSTSGEFDVAAAPQPAPVAGSGSGSGSTGGTATRAPAVAQPGGGTAQQPATGGGTVGQGTGARGGVLPQAPAPGVASRVVPHGSGPASTGGSATNARPQTPLGTDGGQASGQTSLPQLSDNGSPAQVALSDASSRTGLGLPAVVAVVLLSVVTAALVRTLITQRRAVIA